jgi:hypothetical protein
VLLGERECNGRAGGSLSFDLNSLGQDGGSTEIDSNTCFELTGAAGQVLAEFDGAAETAKDSFPVRATIHGPGPQEGQRIVFSTSIVDNDVPDGIFLEFLGEVDVDAEEVGVHLGSFDFLEQTLEPTERRSIPADPEEFNTAESAERALLLPIPDVLEDGGKGSYTNTGTDENSDLRVEHIFSGSTIGTINANDGQGAGVGVGIEFDKVTTAEGGLGIFLLRGLEGSGGKSLDDGRASANTFTETLGPVTNLTDVNGNIGVLGSGGDGEGMPLPMGNVGNLDKEPLTSGVLEAGLDDTEFHGAGRVNKELGKLGLATGTDLPPDTLTKVEDTGPDGETPGKVTNAVTGVVEGEFRLEVGEGRITDEASHGVSVKTEHEEECEVVGVPEGLETLLANFVCCGRVHEDHDQEHDVTSETTRLPVVDIKCISRTDLSALDVDKVDIMSGGVNHCKECHRVSDLTMEPDIFVGGEEPGQLGTDDFDDVAEHGHENHKAVICQDETSATGAPDGKGKSVETSQTGVGLLRVPSITKDGKLGAIPQNIEYESPRLEELSFEPVTDGRHDYRLFDLRK